MWKEVKLIKIFFYLRPFYYSGSFSGKIVVESANIIINPNCGGNSLVFLLLDLHVNNKVKLVHFGGGLPYITVLRGIL